MTHEESRRRLMQFLGEQPHDVAPAPVEGTAAKLFMDEADFRFEWRPVGDRGLDHMGHGLTVAAEFMERTLERFMPTTEAKLALRDLIGAYCQMNEAARHEARRRAKGTT